VTVKSPFTNQTYTMHRYTVNNTAPRPESYLTGVFKVLPCMQDVDATFGKDYTTANAADQGPTLNETQRSELYAELASGAETGKQRGRRLTLSRDEC
jgi:alpha,alpha-trehalase